MSQYAATRAMTPMTPNLFRMALPPSTSMKGIMNASMTIETSVDEVIQAMLVSPMAFSTMGWIR